MSTLACNTRKMSATLFSPMETLMGYTASTASTLHSTHISKKELKHNVTLVSGEIPEETIASRLRILDTLRDEAIKVKAEKGARIKEQYDKKTHDWNFEEGQEVLLYDSSLLKQWSRKLEEKWTGPYVILWKGDLGAYVLDMGGWKSKTVSGDHIKAYHQRV